MNRREVAKILGISYREVKDAEESGLEKCRAFMEEQGLVLRDFLGPSSFGRTPEEVLELLEHLAEEDFNEAK